MLDPRGRQLLLSALRPPDGYRFDCAVGTTYSLDLIALLTTPLAFAMFDWQNDEGTLVGDPASPSADPLTLLESLRRCADRIHIYCQAGQIKVPPANQRLLAYLERAVIEVQVPSARGNGKGVFHPKVWAVRYISAAAQIRYRLLCLSRNLTFDRAWDTILLLEGELIQRQNGFGENRPLAEFFGGLRAMALRPDGLSARAAQDTDRISEELRYVKWELPEDVHELRFWPIGLGRARSWPFPERMDRLLVISPFVTDDFLQRVSAEKREHFLISREESLRALPPGTTGTRWRCFMLQDGVDESNMSADEETESDDAAQRSGLHAKAFIADIGREAHVWTGSANATTAAFGGNIEFLVELVGKKSRLGVDAAIGADHDAANLRPLLAEYVPGTEPAACDNDALDAEKIVDEVRRAIAQMPLRIRISSDATRSGVFSNVECEMNCAAAASASVRCRPVMLAPSDAKRVDMNQPLQLVFGPHAPESISSFVAFEVGAKVGSAEHAASFVLNLPLFGAPDDRKERLLHDLLRDSKTLIRFLLLLLADDPELLFDELRSTIANVGADDERRSEELLPLLEHLLRALYRAPDKIDQVQRLIDDLRKSADGRALLPRELDTIWGPISRVRAAIELASKPKDGAA